MADQDPTGDSNNPDNKDMFTEEDLNKKVEEQVEEKLAKIKASLDNSYKERDEAIKAFKDAQKALDDYKKEVDKNKKKEDKTIEETLKEANTKIEELTAERDVLVKELEKSNENITKLTRDNKLSSLLAGYSFENKKASTMAMKSITELLTYENDTWIGPDKLSLEETVKNFCADPDNAFLLKEAVNSGFTPPKTDDKDDKKPPRTHEQRLEEARKRLKMNNP